MYRYGDLNELDFALPKQKTYDFYWPLHFNPSFVDKTYLNSTAPNMLINARYSPDSMASFMPKVWIIVISLDLQWEASWEAHRKWHFTGNIWILVWFQMALPPPLLLCRYCGLSSWDRKVTSFGGWKGKLFSRPARKCRKVSNYFYTIVKTSIANAPFQNKKRSLYKLRSLCC